MLQPRPNGDPHKEGECPYPGDKEHAFEVQIIYVLHCHIIFVVRVSPAGHPTPACCGVRANIGGMVCGVDIGTSTGKVRGTIQLYAR